MRKAIAILLLLSCTACAGKVVTIPTPVDVTKAVEAVMVSNMPPGDKAAVTKELLASNERMYAATLQRADQAGLRARDVVTQIFSIVASAVGITLAATK